MLQIFCNTCWKRDSNPHEISLSGFSYHYSFHYLTVYLVCSLESLFVRSGRGIYILYTLSFLRLVRDCHWVRFPRLVPIQPKYSYLAAPAHQITLATIAQLHLIYCLNHTNKCIDHYLPFLHKICYKLKYETFFLFYLSLHTF